MTDAHFMQLALRLARRGCGAASPNPMVGAVLVKNGKIIGRGWHRRAGEPHAEIEAMRNAEAGGNTPSGATKTNSYPSGVQSQVKLEHRGLVGLAGLGF